MDNNEVRIYFEVTVAPGCEVGACYGMLSVGTGAVTVPELPYEQLAEAVNVAALADRLCVAPERVRIITPEEYDRRCQE